MSDPEASEPGAGAPAPAPSATPAAAPAAARQLPEGWEQGTLERLLFATLEEQRSARRWRSFVRLAWLALFVFLIWTVGYRGTPATDKSTSHTAVVEIKGEISSDSEARAEFIVAAAKAAFEDQGAQGVVLLINSPGGSPVQAGIITDELLRLRHCTRSRCMPWWKSLAHRPRTTSRQLPTASTWTRPASWAASAC